MPIYEYRCKGCGRVVEIFNHSAAAIIPPPECRCGVKNSFERIYSAFATQNAASGCEAGDCCEGGASTHSCCGNCTCGHHHG